MKHKHPLLKRALSIVLSFAIVLPASLAMIGDSSSAHAASKNRIQVLAIEPSDSECLTEATVASWGYTGTVNITYVSSLEFAGCVEDLVESYDLIYVGDNGGSTSGLRLDSGFLYANIGATTSARIPESGVGLTDAEYINTRLGNPYSSYYDLVYRPLYTRYSGNDLTPMQLASLNEYAVAGHPVIYGNGLTSGTVRKASNAVTFTAHISGVQSDGSTVLTASAVATSGTLPTSTPTYQWYSGAGTLIYGATSSTYTTTTSNTYYCTISYTVNGTVCPPATSNRLIVTIAQTTATYSGTAIVGASDYYYYRNNKWRLNTYYHSVDVSISSGILTATATKYSGNGDTASYSYQWYKASGAITDATDSTYTPTTSGTYYCITNVTYVYYNGWWWEVSDNSPSGRSIDAIVTVTPTSITNDVGHPGSSGSIPAFTALNFTISATKVDNCSNMYTFLDGNKSRPNVMRWNPSSPSDIDTATLLGAINLSEPTINFTSDTSYPTPYTAISSSLAPDAGNPASYTLKYTFTITNPTDTTPDTTSYYCYLSIDTNMDGIYSTSERISGAVIKNSNGTTVTSGNLKADGTTYVVTYTLPAGVTGIIPWNLEVVDTLNESVRTSSSSSYQITDSTKKIVNYTRIQASTDKTINILQINASNGLPLDNTGAWFPSSTSRYAFLSLFSDVSTNSDYAIKIQTVTTAAIKNISTTTPITNKLAKDTSGFNTNITYSTASDLINSYDMIILGVGGTDSGQTNQYNGFLISGDGITDYDLNEATVGAIAEYLKSKPVLFTHDTTSWMNLPKPYEDTWNGNNHVYGYYPFYGYFINNILRNPFGLDRFGVTDNIYGHTIKSNPSLPVSGLVAKGYSGITADDKTALASAGYSIAYSPGTNKATTVTETQGFSNYIFTISHDSPATATTVSQVNEGQIAKYPYAINSAAFSRATGAMVTVASTHSQCYQVNMNTADTTVWYCLYDNSSTFENNDVSNAPYIYKHGNATYSGFGNTIFGITSNSPEAKLFVNTIIAASNVSRVPPEVKFSDITGTKTVTNCLLPTDSYGVLTPTSPTSTDRNLYFTITDTNSGAKTINAVISYGTAAGTSLSVNIYNSQTNASTPSNSFDSGVPYYVKIDDILTALGNLTTPITISDTGTPIYVTATTTIGGADLRAKATLIFRKLKLFNLS